MINEMPPPTMQPPLSPAEQFVAAAQQQEILSHKARKYRQAWVDALKQLEAATQRAERAEAMADALHLALKELAKVKA